jgi:hypothetical protein
VEAHQRSRLAHLTHIDFFDPNPSGYDATTKVYSRLCIPGNNVANYGKGIDPVAKAALAIYPAANSGTPAIGTYVYSLGNRDDYTGGIVRDLGFCGYRLPTS